MVADGRWQITGQHLDLQGLRNAEQSRRGIGRCVPVEAELREFLTQHLEIPNVQHSRVVAPDNQSRAIRAEALRWKARLLGRLEADQGASVSVSTRRTVPRNLRPPSSGRPMRNSPTDHQLRVLPSKCRLATAGSRPRSSRASGRRG